MVRLTAAEKLEPKVAEMLPAPQLGNPRLQPESNSHSLFAPTYSL
jgi:hypothetical protein